MVRWQPPPADTQNGEIIDYKIRYKKGTRKSEPLEITTGNQLSKLIDGKHFRSRSHTSVWSDHWCGEVYFLSTVCLRRLLSTNPARTHFHPGLVQLWEVNQTWRLNWRARWQHEWHWRNIWRIIQNNCFIPEHYCTRNLIGQKVLISFLLKKKNNRCPRHSDSKHRFTIIPIFQICSCMLHMYCMRST